MKNFLDSNEYAQWKGRCKEQRRIAAENPCTEGAMATCIDFEVDCSPRWHLRLVLERYVEPPIWHASISQSKDIGDDTVYDKTTGLPIFDVPREGLVIVNEWTPEELDVARSLLGDLMGPLVARPDQRVLEAQRLFAMHWITNEDEVSRGVRHGE